jgi:5-methyltetrahydrofolate--homocysteine methyltransferase
MSDADPDPGAGATPAHRCQPSCPHHRAIPAGSGWGEEPLDHLGYRRDDRADRLDYLGALRERVLIYDGGTGTELFKYQLTTEDYGGEATNGCPEWLLKTRPEIMPAIHRRYFAAGANVVETNSFGVMPHVLAEFGLQDRAEELATLAASVARDAAREFASAEQPRFVAGAIGPGTKLISLGHIAWQPLFDSYLVACRGLIRGGADLILIETAQDILQVKCAVLAARAAMRELGREVPIQTQITVESFGTMLAGTDVAGALTALEALPIDVVGMNCATGPDLMDTHIRYLAEHATRWVSCLPNAGLPRNVGGRAVFDLTPEELARWQVKFVREYGVNAVGGCCGTGPEHIAALASALRGAAPARARPQAGAACLSSLYSATPLKQDAGILIVGERTNATGSKAFRELLFKDDLDGMVALAQEQVAEGAHVLDVSVAWTGRDERKDMDAVMARFATAVNIPIMVDSTQLDVMEIALKHLGGRAIINSVNLEDGVGKFDQVCALAKRYGAALVALTIDEDRAAGMAKSVERKIAIASRMYERITIHHGLPGSGILFDLLTFPITQGDEDTRKLGQWTLEGIAQARRLFPDAGFILGLSNISFGVKANARQVLNSTYLDEAVKCGLTSAILNAAKIRPVNQIPGDELKMSLDLIYDRRAFAPDGSCSYDPLFAFVDHFTKSTTGVALSADAELALPIEARLRRRIIEGRKIGVEKHLDEARTRYSPIQIINEILLDGMKEVGELFGSGKMQLPFVLQSAECMKACVRHLEQFMERIEGSQKGTMVLATVRGDVHDIGKNLVDIILSNNGYKVVNLGIKQPIEDILKAAEAHQPHALGMSGLLVKSTVVMKENLEHLAARGLTFQVLLGGAALNRAYVENDLRQVYSREALKANAANAASAGAQAASAFRAIPDQPAHLVWYAADAFDGLQLMNELCGQLPPAACRLTTRSARVATVKTAHEILAEKLEAGKAWAQSDIQPAPRIPLPPFWGRRTVLADELDIPTISRYINTNALYRGQWGFRQGQTLSAQEWQELVAREAEPVLKRLVERAARERLLEPKLCYGFFPCASERNDLVVFDEVSGQERARFNLPRQSEPGSRRLCVSDFFRARGAPALGGEQASFPAAAWANGARDVLAMHVVTMGEVASRECQRLFAADSYQEYLYFYGLSVECAEALAEYWHKRIRQQLGIAGDDALELPRLFTQGYQGSRYSFGYPACPRLEDQRHLQELLRWQEIGIELSEEFQLSPEQSTSALIVHHPQAKYFNL